MRYPSTQGDRLRGTKNDYRRRKEHQASRCVDQQIELVEQLTRAWQQAERPDNAKQATQQKSRRKHQHA